MTIFRKACLLFLLGIVSYRSVGQTSGLQVIFPGDTVFAADFEGQEIRISHRKNNVAFQYSSEVAAHCQFFLDGFDAMWTPWKNTGFKEYTNLPPGHYVFQTRMKEATGITGMSSVQIRILKPWYLTYAFLVSSLVLFALFVRAVYEQLNLRFARKQYQLEQIINKRTEDLIVEKEKSDALLANVLPRTTANEIMAKGKATKIKYNFVTVLFSDIQGFTRIAEEMNPEVLIDELDKFFFYFDSVVEKFGIEKIKTIGDAYMCAGGIPEKNRTNPVEVILAALEMKAYMKRLKTQSEILGMKYWDIRMGIHTGTVVAGVVGQKKLSYDIWGDTVNTASRMESSGEAGKINISGTTYEFVKDFFSCEYRGKMPVKYKGELEMYFVKGIAPGLCDENGDPNSRFMMRMQAIKLLDVEDVVIRSFEEEASPNLYFHNSALVKGIINHVELLSTSEKLPEEDFISLKLAAMFLFTGYIFDYEEPSDASIRYAEEILPKYGFSPADIHAASNLIRNSYQDRIESLSDRILHDARYDYLGRVDYSRLTEKLLRELTEYGKHTSPDEWILEQRELLTKHEFLTDSARLLRNVPVVRQLENIATK
jgi:adenylate cyclase